MTKLWFHFVNSQRGEENLVVSISANEGQDFSEIRTTLFEELIRCRVIDSNAPLAFLFFWKVTGFSLMLSLETHHLIVADYPVTHS